MKSNDISEESKEKLNYCATLRGIVGQILFVKHKKCGYVAYLFKWKNDSDINPRPLNKNYQLVWNIVAAGVKPDSNLSLGNGHVLLIYDARNPSFQQNGDGLIAYTETREALQENDVKE